LIRFGQNQNLASPKTSIFYGYVLAATFKSCAEDKETNWTNSRFQKCI